jgi:hypothetical protein
MEEGKKSNNYKLLIEIDDEGRVISATQANGEPLSYDKKLEAEKITLVDGNTSLVRNAASGCRWRHHPSCWMICV